MNKLEHDEASHHEIATLAAEIVGAYVGHHTLAAADLRELIATVGEELAGVGQAPADPEEDKPTPAVPIKRSVREDEIVCLVCGKPQKMMKRNLATRHELEPDAYRGMFGLKDDYPMVAQAYVATRSALARKIGLGRKPELEKPAKPTRAPRKRARKSAAEKG
ncbi:MAG: MucR family transcriptional regulator [Rhizobiales bacterium]|nr:MucR family transcriptional regulator [Hyphomicrobiales bacterium]